MGIIRGGMGGSREQLGGKAYALAELEAAGFAIPAWLAIPGDAVAGALAAGASDAAAMRRALEALDPAAVLGDEFAVAMKELRPGGESVAVRSSAVDEDSAEHSFAGQLDSYLFVEEPRLSEAVRAVWLSGFSERVIAYRRENGLPMPPPVPTVIVQQMVDAEVSGVAFGADPASGRAECGSGGGGVWVGNLARLGGGGCGYLSGG